MKIFKNKFFTSTFILIFSGLATKGLGLIIKIIYTRIVGTQTIALYTLVMPTYSLILTITTFAMPTTIAKIIAQSKNPRIIKSAFYIIVLINFIIIILMHILSSFIANTLLNEPNCYPLLIAMSYTLPFASIASILKGYFYGIQKMVPHVISNLVEQIIRIVLIIVFVPYLMKISYIYAGVGLILTSFITELASIIVFLLFMNKQDKIILKNVKFNINDSKDIINLSLPNVSSSIIANICYFLEPVILTNVLSKNGYNTKFIISEYAAYNAYAISTLTIPSFFINAISLALIPEIAKNIVIKNYQMVKKRLKESYIYVLLIGVSFTLIIFLYRNELLEFLYKTNQGANYIKILAPFFILFYFESIFSAFMQAIGKTKITFRITVICSFIKIFLMFILSYCKIGIYSLIIAEIVNIVMVVTINKLYINNYLKKNIT